MCVIRRDITTLTCVQVQPLDNHRALTVGIAVVTAETSPSRGHSLVEGRSLTYAGRNPGLVLLGFVAPRAREKKRRDVENGQKAAASRGRLSAQSRQVGQHLGSLSLSPSLPLSLSLSLSLHYVNYANDESRRYLSVLDLRKHVPPPPFSRDRVQPEQPRVNNGFLSRSVRNQNPFFFCRYALVKERRETFAEDKSIVSYVHWGEGSLAKCITLLISILFDTLLPFSVKKRYPYIGW